MMASPYFYHIYILSLLLVCLVTWRNYTQKEQPITDGGLRILLPALLATIFCCLSIVVTLLVSQPTGYEVGSGLFGAIIGGGRLSQVTYERRRNKEIYPIEKKPPTVIVGIMLLSLIAYFPYLLTISDTTFSLVLTGFICGYLNVLQVGKYIKFREHQEQVP